MSSGYLRLPDLSRADRSPRGPMRREPLTLERIVDAAFDVLASDGFDALTMRRLAAELGTGPASLYAHVENKRELDALLVDRVAATLEVPEPDPDRWQDQVRQLGRDLLAGLRSHRGLARAVMANIPTGEQALRTSEGLLRLLLAGGIKRQVAAWACDLLPLYVTAVAFEQDLYAGLADGRSEEEVREKVTTELRDYFAGLPADRFPHLAGLATEMTAGDEGDRFEFGMSVLLAGLEAVSGTWRDSAVSEAG